MRYIKRGNQTWPLRTYWGRRRWALGRLSCMGNLAFEQDYFTGWELDQLKLIQRIAHGILNQSEDAYVLLKDLYETKEET